MSSSIAAPAQSGFSNAEAYDTHRPSYPPESVDNLLQQLGVLNVPGARILDVGAGTGKFTAILAARPENYEIVAVEPHADMRKVLESKGLKGVKIVEGFGDSMPAIEDGWAEATVCAQAFHWFAKMSALKEIHRTLAPGKVLGLIWNIEDYNAPKDLSSTTEWEEKLKEIVWSHTDADPRFRDSEWQKVFDEQVKSGPISIISADPLFSLPLGEHIEKWTSWLSKGAVWDRFHTLSGIVNLKGEAFEDTKRKAFEAMDGADVESNDKGEIALHGRTLAYWTTAVPSDPLKSME